MSEARVGLPEDIDFDPAYRRQRETARHALGIAINQIRGNRASLFRGERTNEQVADFLAKECEKIGILVFDDFHHAPMCPANNWSRKEYPEGPCNCGARRKNIRTVK